MLSDQRTSALAVRCARRGFSENAGYTDKRFVFSYPAGQTEPLIEDVATGLVWQGCVSGHSGYDCEVGTVQEFVTSEWTGYCEGLSWGGHDDWRLPTYKELHSLARYPQSASVLDPQIDDSVFDSSSVATLGCTSGWEPGAVPLLFDVDDGNKYGPGSDYPLMCVRWK